ncbi:MAG: DUF4184 family protein [Kiritimatiellia bacterium]
MPLTIAHPVAVLPFKKIGLPLAALIAGSMAPDLEHFLYLAPRSDFSHTLPGLFLFSLPAGAVLLWFFCRLWLPAAQSFCSLPANGLFVPPRHFLRIGLGILLGSVTHIIWDAFTHEYGFAVLRLPALSATVWDGHWYALPVFKILQHGSGLLGLGILGLLALRHRRQWPVLPRRTLVVLAAALFLAALLALASVLIQRGLPTAIRGLGKYLGATIVRFAFITLAGATLLGLTRHFRIDRTPDKP